LASGFARDCGSYDKDCRFLRFRDLFVETQNQGFRGQLTDIKSAARIIISRIASAIARFETHKFSV
jgi:hypothetical protein